MSIAHFVGFFGLVEDGVGYFCVLCVWGRVSDESGSSVGGEWSLVLLRKQGKQGKQGGEVVYARQGLT